jgi:hypothetical protein
MIIAAYADPPAHRSPILAGYRPTALLYADAPDELLELATTPGATGAVGRRGRLPHRQ